MQSVVSSEQEKERLKAVNKPAPPYEEAIHKQVIKFLNLACPENGEVIWWHTPNSGKHKPQYRTKLAALGLRSGIPDLVFIWPFYQTIRGIEQRDFPIGLKAGFIELKRKLKKDIYSTLSAHQEKIRLWSERMGINYAVCASADAVEYSLHQWQVPLKASMRIFK